MSCSKFWALVFFFLFQNTLVYAQSANSPSKKRQEALAVADLADKGVGQNEADIISERLRSELSKIGYFQVMDRGNMDLILKEQGFQNSGVCSSEECQVQIGQLLGVEKFAAGQAGKIGSMYTLSVRLIKVETGEIQKSVTRDYKGDIEDLLVSVIPDLARELSEIKTETSLKSDSKPSIDSGIQPHSASDSSKRFWIQTGLYGFSALFLTWGVISHLNGLEANNDYKKLPAGSDFNSEWEKVENNYDAATLGYSLGAALLAGGIVYTIWF